MAIPITVPRLGWNMEEGTFAGWLKQDGEAIRAGEMLFRLESDKATEEIECLESGIVRLAPGAPKEGDRVQVGDVIAYVDQPGAQATGTPVTLAPVLRGEGLGVRGSSLVGAADPLTPTPLPLSTEGEGLRHASPRARRVARELGVDWTTLTGTGRSGRIRERDVRAMTPRDKTLTPIRRTIARRMHESHQTTAPVTLTTTADATNLVNLREQFRAVAETLVPSYGDFLLKLTARALEEHPRLTAPTQDIHLGLAVDTEAGLLVPVLRDVSKLSLRQVATKTRELIARARQGQLTARDMQGGTFTLTNLGAHGIDAFTPIINLPECAILGVGRIRKQAVVVEDRLVPREQITLSLTFDHRLVDGAPAARFLQTLVGLIENPGPSLMS